MDRRSFVRRSAAVALGCVVGPSVWPGPARAQGAAAAHRWAFRRVRSGDEGQLVGLMRACVDNHDSFHGLCRAIEWTTSWAEGVVSQRSRSMVVTRDRSIVGYFDLPSRAPRAVGVDEVDRYRRSFWCGAAGVRLDLLGREQAIEVFQQLLCESFADAMSLGYEFVRAAAPWDRHPYLPTRFADYPGLTVEPFEDEAGAAKFLIAWSLPDALQSLSAELNGRS